MRRYVLTALGTALTGTLAGCSELSSEEYENLQEHPVYIDLNVELSIPDTMQIVDAPKDANLIVIPDTHDIAAPQAVEWLKQKRVIALLGGEAWSTWLSWVETDAYEETFEHPDMVGERLPDSRLVITWPTPAAALTAQYRLESEPSDSDILTALDNTIEDIRPRTTESTDLRQ